MLLTMQTLVAEAVPDELKIVRSEVSSSATDGALLSIHTIMAEAEKVNQRIAGEANVMGYYRLRDSLIITLTQQQMNSAVAEISLPDRVAMPMAFDAVDSTDNSFVLQPIWYHDPVDVEYDGYADGRYEIRSDVIRIRQPEFDTYRLQFQRTPGPLCYGTVTSGSTTTAITVNAVTAGSLAVRDDAYIGDFIALIETSGAIEVRKISDYVASTKTFTVSEAFSTDPDGTESFSIISFLPDSHQDILTYGTAAAMKDIPERASMSAVEFQSRLDNFKSTIKPVELRTPRKPLRTMPFSIGRPLTGGGGQRRYGHG